MGLVSFFGAINRIPEHRFGDIGTDATIAQHIQTIIDREYVIERMDGTTKHLLPSTLGIGLVEGYNQIGFDRSLSKPQLRREVCVLLPFPVTNVPTCETILDRRSEAWFRYAKAAKQRMRCWCRALNNIRTCMSWPKENLPKSLR